MIKQMYKYPPDITQCQKHRLATRIFKGIEQSSQINVECQCCGRKVGEQQENTSKSCCFSNSQLAFLGPGIPLFFSFILSSIAILISLTLIFFLFAIISNILSNDCQAHQDCTKNIFNTLSIVNKIDQSNYLSVQNYMLLTFVVFYIVLMNLIRYKFRKIKEDCDQLIDSPSDYAIILRRMANDTSQADIRSMVEDMVGFLSDDQKRQMQSLRIIKILLAPDMHQITEIMQKNAMNFKKMIKQERISEFKPEELPDSDETGNMAIVIFARQQSKIIFSYRPNIPQKMLLAICSSCQPLSDFIINGKNVAIRRAPQPDDIIWQNGSETINSTICRRLIINIVTISMLVAGGAGQYGLALFANTLQNQTAIFYLGIASSLVISLMNQIILTFLRVTSNFQKFQTITGLNTVLMKKISFFLFLNAGVFNVAANILANPNDFSLQGNLSNEITFIMILNSLTPNASVFFIDYFDVIGKIKRFLFKRDCIIKQLSQTQANKIYQKPGIDLPYQYGYIIRTLWLTAFYCPLSPIVIPISLLGLTLNYWIEKCLHSKSYKAPNMIWTTVNNQACQLLDFIPLIMSMGQFLIFLYFVQFNIAQIPDYWSIPIYISIGISVFIIVIPADDINHKLFKLQIDTITQPAYEDVQQNFEVTYQTVHPIEKKHGKNKRKRDKFFLASLFGHGKETHALIDLTTKTDKTENNDNTMKQGLIGGFQNYANINTGGVQHTYNYDNSTNNGNVENPLNYLGQKQYYNNNNKPSDKKGYY